MLIIAIPKSSSSSLLKTLSNLHEINDNTKIFRATNFARLKKVPKYQALRVIHSEMLEINKEIVHLLDTHKNALYKHHFPPTDNNQHLLTQTKKVILLRKPEEIIDSYRRGDQSGVFPIKDIRFLFCFSRKSWLRKAQKVGLYENLQNFYDGWESHQGDKLVIYYDEVVNDTLGVVKKIEKYFNLPVNAKVVLEQERYSRSSTNIKWIQMLLSRMRLLLGVVKRKLLFSKNSY